MLHDLDILTGMYCTHKVRTRGYSVLITDISTPLHQDFTQ